MLTPQEITEKGFVKAVFGGYDMEDVDNFLETVHTDYNSLYKDNQILKGKLKVLVEKVEEYRSTEDAMRMALLTAQRMGEEITHEANRNKDEMLQKAENEIKTKLGDTAKQIADEELRLAIATKETAKFIELSQAIIRKHTEFLDKLETVRRSVKTKSASDQKTQEPGAAAKTPRSAKQASPAKPAPPPKTAPAVKPPPTVKPIQPTQPDSSQEVVFDDIAEQIGSVVGQLTQSGPSSPPPEIVPPPMPPPISMPDEPPSSLFVDEEEDISPRPKFDFDDLKFGANFDSDE